MKKLISMILILTLSTLMLFSCGKDDEKDPDKLNIGVMSGPTGMGMAELMSKDIEGYTYEIYNAPTNATTDLLNGTIDLLCLPTNTAANLYTKSNGKIQVLAINCLGSLYLLSDSETTITSIADLEGKTIYASVPSSTTGPIIEYILAANHVNATVKFEPDHDALVAKVAKGEASIVILPEPKVSAALMNAKDYSVDLNLSEEWDKVSDEPLTMGCIVARTDFINANKQAIDTFLGRYKTSIEFIGAPANNAEAANMIYEQAILPKLPIAKSALTNLYGSIVYIDGNDMKSALEGFYESIGLDLPDANFYYNAE